MQLDATWSRTVLSQPSLLRELTTLISMATRGERAYIAKGTLEILDTGICNGQVTCSDMKLSMLMCIAGY